MNSDDYIRGLLIEREILVNRGLSARVAAVDAELKAHGYSRATTKPAAKERAVKQVKPETRG